MRRFALMLILCAAPVAAEEWRGLDGAEIAAALTDRVLVYDDAQQDFRASGRTLYNAGQDSWGYWNVRGDQYCSMWPPSDLWACFDLEAKGEMLRFVGQSDDITEAVYKD